MTGVCEKCQASNADPSAKFCRECGAMLPVAVEDPDHPLLGKIVLDRYRVVKLIGEGGMGKVYLAEQKMGNAVRKVAIKTLHREFNRDAHLVARFYRECETVIELSHPNTVKFYDFGELSDGTLVLVMEYIQGESLAEILDRGPMDVARVDPVLIQICGSLHEAHQHGVVHRDLKPENILLTTRGGQRDFVKVLDFGIAKRSEAEDKESQKLTKQGTVLGTPPYMSPEQFSGQALDSRSDIYSLGVITFEMLTGRLPHEANTPWEWATKHLTAEPIPLESFPDGAQVDPSRRAAVMSCLDKSPDGRPASALDYMSAFTGAQDPAAAWTYATASRREPALSATGSQPMSSQTPPPPAAGGAKGSASASFDATGETPLPEQARPPIARTAMLTGPESTPTGGYGPARGTPSAGHSFGGMPPAGGPASMAEVHPPQGAVLPRRSSFLPKAVALAALLGMMAGGGWWLLRPGPVNPPPQANVRAGTSGLTGHAGVDSVVDASAFNAPAPPDAAPVAADPDPADPDPNMGPSNRADVSAPVVAADTPPGMRPASAVSAADLRRGRELLQQAAIAVGSQDVAAAARAIRAAKRLLGPRDSGVLRQVSALGGLGAGLVGRELSRGQCGAAQRIYRQLRGAGAHRRSMVHNADWCRLR